jgi:uncharacterized membrane protein YedE/YeeE
MSEIERSQSFSFGAWFLDSLAFPAAGLWSWWLGALALAMVAIGFSALLGRPFGVSTAIGRVLDPLGELAQDRESVQAVSALLRGTETSGTRPDPRDTWIAQLVFVSSIALGGFMSAILAGNFGVSSYGALHASLFGSGLTGVLALFVGGLLVGFGTQLLGGCTSGHGLVGCARLQGPSLLATACFFGTAVVVSLLLSWVRS